MAHFSVPDNGWIADGTPGAQATQTSAIPFFWVPTNQWVTGTVTKSTAAPFGDGKPYFCSRTNQWTSGTC
jgi:hypothetical protein